MRTKLRSKVTLLFMTLGLLLAIPAVAFADNIQNDVAVSVNPNDLGAKVLSVQAGQKSAQVGYRINATGGDTGDTTGSAGERCNLVHSGSESITISGLPSGVPANSSVTVENLSGTTLSAPHLTFTQCGVDQFVKFNVGSAVAAGDYTISVADISNLSPDPGANNIDGYNENPATFTLRVTAPPNQAPNTPSNLNSNESLNKDGAFTLSWDAADPVDPNSGDTVTYTLEHRDSNDPGYTTVASGLTGTSYTFGTKDATTNPTGTDPEGEGTWDYQVKAVDNHSASSGYNEALDEVVVDKSNPKTPLASFSKAAEDTVTGWYANAVTVSYGANPNDLPADPNLIDTSVGSGILGYTLPELFNTAGQHTYSGVATDYATNVSTAATSTVKVDTQNPVVTCPNTSAIYNDPNASASWTAADPGAGDTPATGSGLSANSSASGSVPLNTSSIGTGKTATVAAGTVADKVGKLSAAATCNYSVAADFDKFLQPIDGNTVNAGKVGRAYPLKWQLTDANGALLTDDTLGTALANAMTIQQKGVPCAQGDVDTLETDVAAGSTTFRFDGASDQFVYNYKAPSVKGCYDLTIFKADGVNPQTIKFTFTR
jgi:hypothetical protein